MLVINSIALLASAAVLVATAPAPQVPAAPVPALVERATSCTFSAASAAIASKTACATIVLDNVLVPAGQTLDLTGLNTGTQVVFQGTTTFGYKEWEGPLIAVSGTKITVTGASGNVIDGDGARWWDGLGGNGGKTKPKFFKAGKLFQSSISGLNIRNTPVQCFSISGSTDLVLDKITIDNSAGDTQGGHNTDAFDVGTSTGITISNAHVQNQDDCLAINSGNNIVFSGGYCSGGHGLSIGSVGGRASNDVSNVLITGSQIVNSDNGVRIKTVYDATGSVNNVTYSDITLSGIHKYGIVIEQDYQNGSPTGTPTGGVPITNVTIRGVTGSVDSSATAVYILCAEGACSNWAWSGVSITGGQTSSKCLNVPSPATCSNMPSSTMTTWTTSKAPSSATTLTTTTTWTTTTTSTASKVQSPATTSTTSNMPSPATTWTTSKAPGSATIMTTSNVPSPVTTWTRVLSPTTNTTSTTSTTSTSMVQSPATASNVPTPSTTLTTSKVPSSAMTWAAWTTSNASSPAMCSSV